MRSIVLSLFLFSVLGLEAQKPNIIVIVSDDQSFNSIGYTSLGQVYTPTLDQLARDGMIYTNAHHPVTVCSPSRYTMLTGKYSGRCQGEEYLAKFPPGTLTRTENNCELTLSEDHLGKILGRNGYSTGFVGKSHIMEHDILAKANWPSYGLQSYGQTDDPYDPAVSAKMKHNHEVYQSIVRSYGFDYADGIYMANVKELRNDALNVHNLEWTVDKARTFIEQEKDNPFFLFFSTTLHHGPAPWGVKNGEYWSSFDADPKLTGEGYVDNTWDFMPGRQEIQDKYIAAGFPEKDAYALLLDEGIKAIRDKLVELDLEENTLIIFIPDHGMWRHGKATLHDYGLKVPMLMYWKGKIIPGSNYDGLVQTVDFLPTLLDIAGIDFPAGLESDGVSLKTIIETGNGESHSSLFSELGYARAVKTKDWKYIAVRYPEDVQDKIDRGETFPGFEGRILDLPYLTNNSHLGYYASKNNPHYFEVDQLYDLKTDSAETVNVVDQHPEVLQELRELLSEYLLSFEDRPFREFTLTASDPPSRASTPLPRNGSADVDVSTAISWISEYKAESHDVYFGKTNPPPFAGNQESSEFDPGILEGATTYFWRIDEKNSSGTKTGDTWSFTTGSALASIPVNPFPEFNASSVPKNTILKWDKSSNASYYKLYLGLGSADFVADLTEEQYDPGYLKSTSVYFWRVDAVNPDGKITTGTPWGFKTGYGNIAPGAGIQVSSLADEEKYAIEHLYDGIYLMANTGEWRSDGESDPWIELTWDEPAVVDQVNLYDMVGTSSHIIDGEIVFSDASKVSTGELPDNGEKKSISFSPREISSLKLTVKEGVGEIGLAEIEVLDTLMYVSSREIRNNPKTIRIFPNPAPGGHISISGLSESGDHQISIYKVDGKRVAVFITRESEAKLDLSWLSPGIYFLNIHNGYQSITEKLVI